MDRKLFVLLAFSFLGRPFINSSEIAAAQSIGRQIDAGVRRFVEISAEGLEDKIRGNQKTLAAIF